MIRSQLAAGRLIRVRQGVFVAAAREDRSVAEQYILRAQAEQARHPRSVISHASAAAMWGLPTPTAEPWSDQPVTLTVESGARPRHPGVVYHLGALPKSQVVRSPAGYRVTTPARTAVDIATGLALPEGLVVLDAAARLACDGFVTQVRRRDYRDPGFSRAARALLSEAARTRRRSGLQLIIELADPCRESAIESLSAGYFELAGLPRPLYQEPVRTAQGVYFPDCLWPQHRLVGEADGATKYLDQKVMIAEKQREQALRDQGFGIVRWLGQEIMFRPEAVVERVARALAARNSLLDGA